MIQVLGYSTPLLPYQASPIVVAMGLGKCLRGRECCCVSLAAVSYLILLPLDYLVSGVGETVAVKKARLALC
jgi:hypothetical protein